MPSDALSVRSLWSPRVLLAQLVHQRKYSINPWMILSSHCGKTIRQASFVLRSRCFSTRLLLSASAYLQQITITDHDPGVMANEATSESDDGQTDAEDVAVELTDLSELDFSFEDNDAEPSAAADLDIDMFEIHGDAEDPRHQCYGSGSGDDEPDIDGFVIEGDSDSDLPHVRRQPVEVDDEPEPAEYYVSSLGQLLGPMPLTELVGMADSGALSETDRVRKGETGQWIDAQTINQVAASFLLSIDRDDMSGAATMSAATARRIQSPSRPAGAETAAEAAQTDAAKPVPVSPSPKKKQTGESEDAATDVGRKKKRKRTGKKDPFLEQIFAEVFTEDGEVREDRKPVGQPVPAMAPTPNEPVAGGMGMSSAASMGASSGAASPASPPRMPPRRMARPKKSGGGLSIPSLSVSPKMLGIGGGLLAVVLLLGAFMGGFVSLPAFEGAPPDAREFLTAVTKEYEDMEGKVKEGDWKVFRKKVQDTGRRINRSFLKMGGSITPEQNKLRKAVGKFTALVMCKHDDKTGQRKQFNLFKATLEGAGE